MSHGVLVLNKQYRALRVVSIQRAMNLIMGVIKGTNEPKAHIVDPSDWNNYSWADWSKMRPTDGDDVIRTATTEYRLPKIIVLNKYDKLPKQSVKYNRRAIYHRDNHTCQYCGSKPGTEELNLDHVVPRAQGGKSTWENVVIACVKCNSFKRDRTPEQAGMKLLRKPFKPKVMPFRMQHAHKCWEHFMSEMFWTVELENDNP